jgi:hypothetical protein
MDDVSCSKRRRLSGSIQLADDLDDTLLVPANFDDSLIVSADTDDSLPPPLGTASSPRTRSREHIDFERGIPRGLCAFSCVVRDTVNDEQSQKRAQDLVCTLNIRYSGMEPEHAAQLARHPPRSTRGHTFAYLGPIEDPVTHHVAIPLVGGSAGYYENTRPVHTPPPSTSPHLDTFFSLGPSDATLWERTYEQQRSTISNSGSNTEDNAPQTPILSLHDHDAPQEAPPSPPLLPMPPPPARPPRRLHARQPLLPQEPSAQGYILPPW